MKRTLTAIFAIVLIVSMVACNNNTADISNASAIDIAAHVRESVSFLDDMLEVKNEIAEDFYNLPEGVVDLKVYMSSSGATAEELAIFKCESNEVADEVVNACEKRVEALKEKFEDYIPAELTKIESAVIQKRDCFVMFVCAAETAPAEESFENYK